MKKKSISSFLLPMFIVSAISFLGIFAPIFTDFENKLYDASLRVKPLAPIVGEFLSVQVDDKALDLLKMYPLKRSTLADGMLILREFGASTILLDTQLVDPSVPGMNSTKFNELPNIINQVKSNALSMSTQLINAYADGQLGRGEDALEEAAEYITELEWEYDDLFDTLLFETNQVALDYDKYISNIFSFTGIVYVTNDFEVGKEISDDFKKYLEETQAIKNIVFFKDPFEKREGHNPAIQAVMESAKGSGFVETLIDSDGKTRKSHIIVKKDNYYYPHLSLRSFIDNMGNPEINVYKNKVILKGVNNGVDDPFNLTIPLANDGSMAINWAGTDFMKTFDSINFYLLYQYDLLLNSMKSTVLKVISNPNTTKFAGKEYNQVINLITQADNLRQNGDPNNFTEYKTIRDQTIEMYKTLFLSSEDNITLNMLYRSALENFLSQQEMTENEQSIYLAVANEIDKIFNDAAINMSNLLAFRETLENKVNNRVVTLGYTATSTFDIGSNPFEEKFFNMGIYPTLYNNLLSGKFITLSPIWVSIIIAFIFALIATIIIKKNEAKNSIIFGSILFILLIGLYLGLLIFTGIYISILVPSLSFILVFIQKISGKLLSTSKDKTFIKNAFGQYLSEDVIKDIINDPSKLKLGGEEKEITAFFTDVKGFSTISEKLTPDELVSLLNEYLTTMSDIALAHKGTIDKYEGDAIIGFFGAPAPLPDHATKAVLSAIRMKEVEIKLNERFLSTGMTPSPVNTRIGINSGPCVVGNMGTPRKMDYTMMGSDVNIAARLEGVNKQYGTWILASERTMEKAEDIFLTRRLDRVRVVGINKPIRLYNPLAVRSEASKVLIDLVNEFEKALSKFEERDWKTAKNLFKNVLNIDPDDKPSVRYIQLCEKFIEKEPEQNWDGVFNLTSK